MLPLYLVHNSQKELAKYGKIIKKGAYDEVLTQVVGHTLN
jgi:hypothetical protein